ncbi:MAG: outer membrane beta-barrel protein [Vicinamibacterales bacterium]
MRRNAFFAAACAVVVLGSPSLARADGFVSPFLGVNFGGDAGQPLRQAIDEKTKVTFGLQAGQMGGGVFGFELDIGYTPHFYGTGPAFDNNVLTIIPGVVLGVPLGGQTGFGVRPYVTAGAGLVRRQISLGQLFDLSQNDLAYSLGGGVMAFVSDHFGVRGDVRYIRNFRVDEFGISGIDFEKGTFNFGRASIGAVFRY